MFSSASSVSLILLRPGCIGKPDAGLLGYLDGHRPGLFSKPLVPQAQLIFSRRDVADVEPTGSVRYRGIGMVGNNDMRPHPGMQHITINQHMTRLRKTIGFLGPVRQTQIEYGLVAILAGVNIMQDEVAVTQRERLPDGYGLDAGDKGAVFIVQQREKNGVAFPGVNAVQDDDDILEAPISINQKALIRHAFPADRSVLVNGQDGRWWYFTVEYDLSADATAVLNCDFPVSVYRGDNDEEAQKNPPAHRVSRRHSLIHGELREDESSQTPILHDSGWCGLHLQVP